VHVFDLADNPKATRAYAWSSPIEGSDKRRFFVVLQMGAIKSPRDAVRAAIVAEARQRGNSDEMALRCCRAPRIIAGSPNRSDEIHGESAPGSLCRRKYSPLCITYITGFLYGAYAQKRFNEPMCFPEGVTPLQAVQIVEKYFREKPENLHDDAWMAIAVALSAAFPCKRSN
jgi:hypothetical protein